MSGLRCSWCGIDVDEGDGYRLEEAAGERRAVFCRLEHVVPWAIRGAHWEPGLLGEPPVLDEQLRECSHCGAPLEGELHVMLVHHRGEHRIADGFCNVGHLQEWASAGGRWR